MRANLAALRTLRTLQTEHRLADADDQRALARWSGWGALPAMFDAGSHVELASARAELGTLLSPDELAESARSTINAHYTDAAYVQAVWQAVGNLGFTEGLVLEPGCGSGNFIALAPAGALVTGVELDSTTAAIASALHPHAKIHHESFADSRFAEAAFDLVIGNVPFGDVVLHDRRHNVHGHRIHNHFIVKALHLTKPGGLVAVISSRYTLDSANPAARREMAELADLLGAVRLPTGAHRRAAGTDVVTDLLVFRRREQDRARSGSQFELSHTLEGSAELAQLRVNEYFLAHPQHVLGDLRATQADRGRLELDVVGDREVSSALSAALADIVTAARASGLTLSTQAAVSPEAVAYVGVHSHRSEGYLAVAGADRFTRVDHGAEVPYSPPASQAPELRTLLTLRNAVVSLLEQEARSNDDSPELDEARASLNALYDAYVARYGPINRYVERATGHADAATGERKLARIRPRQGGFRTDPFASAVYALEHFDGSTQTATKASIFRERVLARRPQLLGADTPEDALAICLDTFGEVRLEEVARLLGASNDEARQALGTLVFDEPESHRLVPAAEYLSGNVRAKLAHAERALLNDARYSPNVTALTAVQPRNLAPDEIYAPLGAAWIDRTYVEQFLREILEDSALRVEHPGAGIWAVQSRQRDSVKAISEWGTKRYTGPEIAHALLEQRPIRIYDEGPNDTRVFNAEATDEANEKAREMGERFSEWVWEEPERAAKLAHTYNSRFNAIVPRSYDSAKLALPGLAISFQPRPHQVAAVARIINEPAVGLFHEVGAGKTAEMVIGAMELKRLGLATKPVIVVPNHMLEQFSREWLQMYPQARLLTASNEDLDREHRRLFQAKCATGDWDGIVMTRSAFERVPMSPEAERAYLKQEVEAIEAVLDNARESGASLSVKRLEKLKLRAVERIKEKLDGTKDPGLTFEMLGIDYIFADEAHAYKNLRTSSNIPGMAVDGSQRASDLHMKIAYLRARRSRVATLATATPIANSMGEAFTMQRYLRPDLLEQAGIDSFDQWAATFGRTVTGIEVAPDGSGLRMQTRFASFRNVPELLQLWQVSADIKTAEDLKLPVPDLAARASDAKRLPEVVVVAPSRALKMYVEELSARADRVRGRRVAPHIDNILAITSDGRAAGLDMRLVGEAEVTEPQKVDVAADRIAGIYQRHRDVRYPALDGGQHARPGALQLVFSDLGTPKDDAWNVYDYLREQLVLKGIPAPAVRFIHEAKNDREKAELFAACRDGRVAVLVGSTERMGVGTNVQLRACALHHLDCPWRPADLAQREGRILRQGNANAEVEIIRYVTEGSFDAYLWQTVSRKATFIAQVMRGKLDVRELEDIGDAALSYSEVKALAAGNPLLIEHARVQAEVHKLERLQRAHANKLTSLHWTIRSSEAASVRRQGEVTTLAAAMAQYTQATADGSLSLSVRGQSCTKSQEGNALLKQALMEYAARCTREVPTPSSLVLGALYDFPIAAAPGLLRGDVQLELSGVPGTSLLLSAKDLSSMHPVTRLLNRLDDLPTYLRHAELDIRRLDGEVKRAREELTKPFRHADLLEASRLQLQAIDAQLHAAAHPPAHVATSSDDRAQGERGASPTPPTPHDDPEGAWASALAKETQAVAERATMLQARIQTRHARLQRQRVDHQKNKPAKPGLVGLATGAGPKYASDVERWTLREQAFHRRGQQLQALAATLRDYAMQTPEFWLTRWEALALRNATRRYPELARAAQDVCAERLLQARNAAHAKNRPRGRSR